MREKYESLALADLKEIAKTRGMKGVSTMKKAELIEAMLLQDEKDKSEGKDVEPKPVLNKPGTPRTESPEKDFPQELDSGICAHGI